MKKIIFDLDAPALSDKELVKRTKEFAENNEEVLRVSNGALILNKLFNESGEILGIKDPKDICFVTEYGEELYAKNHFYPVLTDEEKRNDYKYKKTSNIITVSPIANIINESFVRFANRGRYSPERVREDAQLKRTLVIIDDGPKYNDYELSNKMERFFQSDEEIFVTSNGALAIILFQREIYQWNYPVDDCYVMINGNKYGFSDYYNLDVSVKTEKNFYLDLLYKVFYDFDEELSEKEKLSYFSFDN